MGRLPAVWLLLIASCGRFGFAEHDPIDAPPAAPETLRCDQPTRFQVGATGINAISAVASPDGFALFSASGTSVTGWAYELVNDQLVPTMQRVAVATSETGAIGAATNGSTVMVSAMYGMPATGTALVPLDQNLASLGPITIEGGDLAAANPLASSAGGFAFATMNVATSEVDARLMATFGVIVGAPVKIVDGSELPGYVTIIATASGYAVSYTSAATNPNVDRIELLDANLAVVAGPVTTSNSLFDAESAHVAWAAQSNTYLVTWGDKTTAGDDVWIQIRGPNLEAVTPPTKIASSSYSPIVASDDTGFWVTWASYANSPSPDFLDAAHVAVDGTVTPRAVTGSGGTPNQWAMVERLGQPVLVWTETGGSGPDLSFDPMCN